MTDFALMQRCRIAEERAEDAERRATQAEAAYQQQRQRMLAAEDIARRMVWEMAEIIAGKCPCDQCERAIIHGGKQ